ncbi:hypothetical protein GCM10023336_45470 [Streptomyces similanensis]|uniref:Transposase IS30-like HTH domain-containing protein n=1 Tax=Streptomyces similanensis TaxID=1274988 RepID=A0ABP9KUR9_9ACTN
MLPGGRAGGIRWFRHAGDVNPCLPDEVSGRYLSFPEREDIAVWHTQGAGVRETARRLGRAPSTISRELRRNASTRTCKLDYRASTAQWHAERRARTPEDSQARGQSEAEPMSRTGCRGTSPTPEATASARKARPGRGATSRTAATEAG